MHIPNKYFFTHFAFLDIAFFFRYAKSQRLAFDDDGECCQEIRRQFFESSNKCLSVREFSGVLTRRVLKERLYKKAMKLLQKGKMFEDAVEVARELETHYESQTFEYSKLADLHDRTAKLYRAIINKDQNQDSHRMPPTYHR